MLLNADFEESNKYRPFFLGLKQKLTKIFLYCDSLTKAYLEFPTQQGIISKLFDRKMSTLKQF